jgi:peptidylprolyl isomerase
MLNRKILMTTAVLAMTVAAAAQTNTKAATTAKPATHTAVSSSALPKNIPPVKGVVHTAYSLKYVDILVGKGALAEPMKMYTVNYVGYLRKDGTIFDSSIPDKDHKDRKPITFPVGVHRVIPGFDTAFEGMHVGGKRRIFIPYQLAYGFQGSPLIPGKPQAIPPKADLIFDVELISIADLPKAPPMPMPTGANSPKPNPFRQTPNPAGSSTVPAKPAAPTAPASPAAAPAAPATTPAAPTAAKPATPATGTSQQ